MVSVAACSPTAANHGAGDLLTPTTRGTDSYAAACRSGTAPTASDVGVTADAITVTVMADVNNRARPGLFKSSWAGVNPWADFTNANGGLGCRKVIVKTADSQLNGDTTRAVVERACTDSFAMVGTSALFFADATPMNDCRNKTGANTGLPDVAELRTEAAQQCSPVSFSAFAPGGSWPYRGAGPRTFKMGRTQYDYYQRHIPNDLHGVFAIPNAVPSTIAESMPLVRAANRLGIKSDFEKGVNGLETQPSYTPVVEAIKTHHSNFAQNDVDYLGTVLERKEAAAQGVNDQVKVWDCDLQCYAQRLISEGGTDVERQYVWLPFLPIEDKGANQELDAFLQYDKQPDGFGLQAWIAGEEFARAVNDAIAAHHNDPNALTRTNLLTALTNLHDFDANGSASRSRPTRGSRGYS
jgi:hypothetical protein